MGALTDVGEQALVEDEALSIPAVLNATVVFRPQIQNQKTSTSTTSGSTTTKTISYGDQVVLIGGRIGPNAGAFVELGGGAFGNHQLFTSFDLGGVKAGLNYYNTGFGEDAGLQLGNVWGQHGAMMGMRSVSANQKLFKGEALGGGQFAGLAAWAGNDMGAIQIGLVVPSDGTTFGGNFADPTVPPAQQTANDIQISTWKAAPMIRAQGFFDVGGMSAEVGAIFVSGNVGDALGTGGSALNNVNTLFAAGTQAKLKRWGLEAALEGEMGDTQFGVYADYASAAKSSGNSVNLYNGFNAARQSKTVNGWSIRGTVKPVHNLVLGLGYGQLKRGLTGDVTNKTLHVAAEYEFYQNFVVALTYTDEKGVGFVNGATTKTTLLDIEALL
ncbi:MAG: hypothetical protein D6751_02120 [Deltaproteobacteria bacterium]|nr:MAG: hypothetical protein D6751_02120 [Deltaproteobacteria bacterium]